jgi:2-dehydro-3-deoxyphosphooctonate aldolase (KDO 8-P synthase)
MSQPSTLFEELKTSNPLFFLIAGPCVIESREHCLAMAKAIKEITDRVGLKLIFKASFDKANRTSIGGFRGVGIDAGLAILKEVKETFGLPILTDVHEAEQCAKVAEVCDVLQIPAFLCRQTDLLIAAAKTGRIVNIKKGQFANTLAMTHAFNKVVASGNNQVILCDRGNMFGYDDMVVDFRNLVQMRENKGALIIQDITHALQQPNRGATTSGLRQLIPTIGRCAVVTGVDGIFMEVHDNPEKALSDSATQWPLDKLEQFLQELVDIAKITRGKKTQYV